MIKYPLILSFSLKLAKARSRGGRQSEGEFMLRYKLAIAYDGRPFASRQIQANGAAEPFRRSFWVWSKRVGGIKCGGHELGLGVLDTWAAQT
jgi:hypothetical protein